MNDGRPAPRAAGRQAGRLRAGLWRGAAAVRSFAMAGAVTGAVAVVACGCAMVPASGGVHERAIPQAGSGQNQQNPQLIPLGPVPGWSPEEIVTGFLAASASFANDPDIALEYLSRAERKSWHPNGAVTVVGNLQKSPTTSLPKRQRNLPSDQVTTVRVAGAQLATLTDSGQYLTSASSSSPRIVYTFKLIKVNNQWRIDQLPTSQLMLTKAELERVYQQRNLYFLDPTGQTLVPDPVFVPQNDTNSDLATQLVRGLLKDPQGWLSGATRTAFPAGTRLLSDVKINGPDATVNLGMPAGAVRSLNREQMAAQLVWTLTSTSYGPSAIQYVELQVNGQTLRLQGSQYQLPKLYQDWLPGPPTAGPYFISHDGSVRAVTGAGHAGSTGPLPTHPIPGQAGTTAVPAVALIAVEPNQESLAAISADRRTVFTGGLNGTAPLTPIQPGGSVNALSWDRSGDLWVTAGNSVWMLVPGTGSTVQTDLGLPAGDQVTSFRVAPDGVRVAMIVKRPDGTFQLLLAAITHIDNGTTAAIGQTVAVGAGVLDPTSLTWYDADNVIILAGSGSGAQLEEIPLNGGQPRPIGTLSDTVSVTGDGAGLAVGLANDQLYVSPGLDAQWTKVAATGRDPVYPG